MTNPYSTLGVKKDADSEEIKRAFKKLARQYHPDINKDPGAEERFKAVNAAYDILKDEERRSLFDEFGDVSLRPGFDAEKAKAWRRGQAKQRARGGWSGGFPFDFGAGGTGDGEGFGMEDLINSMFGDGMRGGSAGGGGGGYRTRASSQRKGADQKVRLSVDPMKSYLGGEVTFTVTRPTGNVDRLTVRVPAGAKNGGKLRIPGQGLPPTRGGPAGDLIVQLDIPEHPLLKRIDDNLELMVPVTVLEAMQGARITVPTPTGNVKVAIPAGVVPGQKLRIRGRGVQRRGRPGDLYLVLQPTVPESSDATHVEAAQALESAYGTHGVRKDLQL